MDSHTSLKQNIVRYPRRRGYIARFARSFLIIYF